MADIKQIKVNGVSYDISLKDGKSVNLGTAIVGTLSSRKTKVEESLLVGTESNTTSEEYAGRMTMVGTGIQFTRIGSASTEDIASLKIGSVANELIVDGKLQVTDTISPGAIKLGTTTITDFSQIGGSSSYELISEVGSTVVIDDIEGADLDVKGATKTKLLHINDSLGISATTSGSDVNTSFAAIGTYDKNLNNFNFGTGKLVLGTAGTIAIKAQLGTDNNTRLIVNGPITVGSTINAEKINAGSHVNVPGNLFVGTVNATKIILGEVAKTEWPSGGDFTYIHEDNNTKTVNIGDSNNIDASLAVGGTVCIGTYAGSTSKTYMSIRENAFNLFYETNLGTFISCSTDTINGQTRIAKVTLGTSNLYIQENDINKVRYLSPYDSGIRVLGYLEVTGTIANGGQTPSIPYSNISEEGITSVKAALDDIYSRLRTIEQG